MGNFAPTVFKPVPTGLLYLLLQAVEREISGECPWTTGEECLMGYTNTFWLDPTLGGPKCRNIACRGYRHPWGVIGYTSRSAVASSVDNRFDYSSFRYRAGNGNDWIPVGTLGVMVKFDFGLLNDPGGYGAYVFGFGYYGYNAITPGGREVQIGDKWYISCIAETGYVGPAIPDPGNRGEYGPIITNTKGVAGPAVINVIGTTGTYHRNTGSFISDRFVVGDKITVTGYLNTYNNGIKYVQSVTDFDLVVTDNTDMVTESGTGDERIVAAGAYFGEHDTVYTLEIIDFWGYVQNFNNALLQISLATCTDEWLDFWGDYFGMDRALLTSGTTKIYEEDEAYRARIMKEITRAKGTRAVLLEESKSYFNSDLVTIEEYHQTGVRSVVVGSDGLYYKCILDHIASLDKKPITGVNWTTYWEQGGLGGNTWTDGLFYTAGTTPSWDGPVLTLGDPARGLWPWQFYINVPTGRSPSVKYVKDGSTLLDTVLAYSYESGYGYSYYGVFVPILPGSALFPVPASPGDAALFGNSTQFSGLRFMFSTPGVGGTYIWEYWNGNSWSVLTAVYADLIGNPLVTFTTDGFIHWLEGLTSWKPADNIPYNIPNTGSNLFWVRCRVVTAPITVPVVSDLKLTYAGQTCRGTYCGTNATYDPTMRDKNNCYIYSLLSYVKPSVDEIFQSIIDRLKVAGTAAIINPI